ncbi:MAG: hypothetical protein EOP53_14880 [Sphingobacteriales bacterium]|nr:MAG: hypothetical protein EOP53_14880 [Sphingobacteriales bacterium]
MRFYSLLLALFLQFFMGEFCAAQTWDWAAKTENNYSAFPKLNQYGDIFWFNGDSNQVISTTNGFNSPLYTITKQNSNGNIIGGLNLDVKITKATEANGFFYLSCYAYKDIIIKGKRYKIPPPLKPGKSLQFVIKIDYNCNIIDVKYIVQGVDFTIDNIAVDKDENL